MEVNAKGEKLVMEKKKVGIVCCSNAQRKDYVNKIQSLQTNTQIKVKREDDLFRGMY